jgi:hypothetical protein
MHTHAYIQRPYDVCVAFWTNHARTRTQHLLWYMYTYIRLRFSTCMHKSWCTCIQPLWFNTYTYESIDTYININTHTSTCIHRPPLPEGGFEVCGDGKDASRLVAQWRLRRGYFGSFRDVLLSHMAEVIRMYVCFGHVFVCIWGNGGYGPFREVCLYHMAEMVCWYVSLFLYAYLSISGVYACVYVYLAQKRFASNFSMFA